MRISRRAAARAAYGASLLLHAGLFAALVRVGPPAAPRRTDVVVEIVETARTAPPPTAPARPAPAPREEPPRLEPPRIARAESPPRPAPPPPPQAAPPRHAPEPPRTASPPDAPRPDAPPGGSEATPAAVGISADSTAPSGVAAAPVGNTLHGRAPDRAPAPDAVPHAPPSAEGHAAPGPVITSVPEPIAFEVPRSEYPAAARELDREAQVRLRVAVDEQGLVRSATVLADTDPGYGFGEAAVRIAKRYLRFRPARRGGEPVAADASYTLNFRLE